MKRLISALVVVVALAAAPPVYAQSGSAASDAAAAEEAEQAAWVKRLDEAAARLTDARRDLARLEDAKGRGAARRYPRGEAKEKYIDQLKAAREELAKAEESMPELLEEARRAGVPNGVLDHYENLGTEAEESGEDAES